MQETNRRLRLRTNAYLTSSVNGPFTITTVVKPLKMSIQHSAKRATIVPPARNKSFPVILTPQHEAAKRWGTLASYNSICSTHTVGLCARSFSVAARYHGAARPLANQGTHHLGCSHTVSTPPLSCFTCNKHTSEVLHCCVSYVRTRGKRATCFRYDQRKKSKILLHTFKIIQSCCDCKYVLLLLQPSMLPHLTREGQQTILIFFGVL